MTRGSEGTGTLRHSHGVGCSTAFSFILAALLASHLGARAADAAAVGMVVNSGSGSVTVFDQNTHAVLGSVPFTGGAPLDCSLDGVSRLGYVGTFGAPIWAVDVGAGPPALAGGTNPILSSIPTEDTAITPDGRFLLACDGTFGYPLSVIDLTTRTEASTFPLSGGCQGVEVCEDGSVLVVQVFNRLRRLTIDSSGALTDTGETLAESGTFNTICGKGATTGVAISLNGTIRSFTIPGLTPIDNRFVPDSTMAGVSNSSGDRLYVRGTANAYGFDFDPTTGALGVSPFVSIPIAYTTQYYGVEPLALNAAGTELFVSELNAVKVYSATSGAFVDTITDPAMVNPVGLCAAPPLCGDGTVEGAEACDDGNLMDGDGCDSNCTLTACGNGVVTAGEECDDGNLANGDCCSSTCLAAVDGTACSDGRFCNGADSCSNGACAQHAGDPCAGGTECNDVCYEALDTCVAGAGRPCTDDGIACTLDECDGAGACTHPPASFSPCDDGVFCNGTDLCFDGSCAIHNGDPCLFIECNDRCDELSAVCLATTSGTPCFEDGNGCTSDQCNGLGSCAHPPLPSGTACTSDGEVCTSDQCNGAGACAHPPVADGTNCDDSSACTQTDQCQSGVCVGADPVVCTAPLCHAPGTCEPSTGACATCPAGYTPGGGGCQKTYPIDQSLLDNQDSGCSFGHLYNDCVSPFGFHWSDTADAGVGPVVRVDLRFDSGVDCEVSPHSVLMNGANVGTYPAANSCTCSPLVVPRIFADVDSSAYVKGGANMLEITTDECTGLSRNAQGHFALVTVTYEDLGPLLDFRDDCKSAPKGKLKYKNDPTGTDDVLSWKWSNGIATTQGEFADPTDSADYQFCMFGERSGGPDVLIAAEVPADATLWRAIGSKGYKYKDKTATHDGISKIVAKGGADGKAKIIVKGKGAALSDPTLPLAPGTSGIRVQLTNPATGVCWESEFPFGTVSVDDTSIKGKVP